MHQVCHIAEWIIPVPGRQTEPGQLAVLKALGLSDPALQRLLGCLQGWVLQNYLLKTFAEGAALTKTGIVLQDVRLEPETDPGPMWCMYGLNQLYLFVYVYTHTLCSLNVCVYIYIYKYCLFLVKIYYIAISLETEALGFLF